MKVANNLLLTPPKSYVLQQQPARSYHYTAKFEGRRNNIFKQYLYKYRRFKRPYDLEDLQPCNATWHCNLVYDRYILEGLNKEGSVARILRDYYATTHLRKTKYQ